MTTNSPPARRERRETDEKASGGAADGLSPDEIVNRALGRPSANALPQDDSAESIVARAVGRASSAPDPDQWIRDRLGDHRTEDDLPAEDVVARALGTGGYADQRNPVDDDRADRDERYAALSARAADLGFRDEAMRRTRARARVTR